MRSTVSRAASSWSPHKLMFIRSLFRPYVKLDLSGASLYPRDTCIYCANEISNLMNALRALYGLRRVGLAVTSLLLSASTIHLLNLPSEPSSTHLSQALYDLQAMAVNHTFAGRCVEIIRSLATKWHISLPEGAASLPPPSRTKGGRKGLSPAYSTFWGASIRRGDSNNSGGSSSGQHESPFAPPPHSQQPATSVPAFTDTPMQLDPNQSHMQDVFWTPFPGQTFPVPPQQVLPSMGMDMSSIDAMAGPWDMFDGSTGSNSRHHSNSGNSMAGQVDSGVAYHWNWQ
jgi:hypothetical protein